MFFYFVEVFLRHIKAFSNAVMLFKYIECFDLILNRKSIIVTSILYY